MFQLQAGSQRIDSRVDILSLRRVTESLVPGVSPEERTWKGKNAGLLEKFSLSDIVIAEL